MVPEEWHLGVSCSPHLHTQMNVHLHMHTERFQVQVCQVVTTTEPFLCPLWKMKWKEWRRIYLVSTDDSVSTSGFSLTSFPIWLMGTEIIQVEMTRGIFWSLQNTRNPGLFSTPISLSNNLHTCSQEQITWLLSCLSAEGFLGQVAGTW